MATYRTRARAGAGASASASIGGYVKKKDPRDYSDVPISSRLKKMKSRTGGTYGGGLKTGGTSAATKAKRAARKAGRSTTLGRSTKRYPSSMPAGTIISGHGMFKAGGGRYSQKEIDELLQGEDSQQRTLGGYGGPIVQDAMRAVEEAKAKQEASKQSALGYYQPIQQALSEMSPELISSAQMARMKGTRRAELGAYGQNLASMHTDPYSGVQGAQRRQIGMGIAGRQANMPIELELEVGRTNRQAQLGLYGAQAGVAGGMAGVQMAYQYDPGMEYLKELGYGAGYQGTAGRSGATPGAGIVNEGPVLGGGGIPRQGGPKTSAGLPPGKKRPGPGDPGFWGNDAIGPGGRMPPRQRQRKPIW